MLAWHKRSSSRRLIYFFFGFVSRSSQARHGSFSVRRFVLARWLWVAINDELVRLWFKSGLARWCPAGGDRLVLVRCRRGEASRRLKEEFSRCICVIFWWFCDFCLILSVWWISAIWERVSWVFLQIGVGFSHFGDGIFLFGIWWNFEFWWFVLKFNENFGTFLFSNRLVFNVYDIYIYIYN